MRLDSAGPRNQAERLAAADDSAVDVQRRRGAVAKFGRCELVRTGNWDDAVDPGHALEPQFGDALRIANRADRGRELTWEHQDVQPLDRL